MKTATAKSNCCGPAVEAMQEGLPKVVLVGSPNVGKSLLFNRNMIDESDQLGVRIDAEKLESLLGVPVAVTSSVTGAGIRELREKVFRPRAAAGRKMVFSESVEEAVAEMEEGEEGTVAYLHAGEGEDTLPKIMALGVLPGCRLRLRQRFPSYLFRITHTQYAVDGTVAGAIYVRRCA